MLLVGFPNTFAFAQRSEVRVESNIVFCFMTFFLFLFLQLWNTKHKPKDVIPAMKRSLSDLGLTYADLYLMHWPFACKVDNPTFHQNLNFNNSDLLI